MDSPFPLGPKPSGYYGASRANVIAELTPPLGRVLDVGCGEAGSNEALRAAGATWISGIELLEAPAEVAVGRYDEVLVGDATEMVALVSGPFETILCYDVLEHLVDPGALLWELRGVVRDGGTLHVSIPNARHFSLVWDLALKGTFGYADYGHRDATHLRWFTRRDMTALLRAGGWTVKSVSSSARHRLRELRLPVPAGIVHGLPGEFLSRSWFIVASADRDIRNESHSARGRQSGLGAAST